MTHNKRRRGTLAERVGVCMRTPDSVTCHVSDIKSY